MLRKNKGYTLIESIIFILVIGLLAAAIASTLTIGSKNIDSYSNSAKLALALSSAAEYQIEYYKTLNQTERDQAISRELEQEFTITADDGSARFEEFEFNLMINCIDVANLLTVDCGSSNLLHFEIKAIRISNNAEAILNFLVEK
ncbi:MAG: prepilin-type N-terminal cleavage/methylation domain-containing protein [Nitrospinota bacterium]